MSTKPMRETKEEEAERLRVQLDETRKALQDLVYTVSHDLGAPLRAVTGFSTIIQQKYGYALDEKGRTYMRFISEGGEKAQQMLAGLLRYSRVLTQAKDPSATNLSDALNTVLCELDEKMLATGARIDRGVLPTVWADEEQVRQLLFVLLDNALLYHRPGFPPHITIAAEEDNGFWRVSVSDNGIGIPASQTEKAFQVFRRLNPDNAYPGIGMGLCVAHRIVERHGGEIGVLPAPESGTIVWFTLPKYESVSAPATGKAQVVKLHA